MHLNSKRRKLDIEADQGHASIVSEIDLEIGIRQRLLDTLHSRITWALLLQESLSQGAENVSDVAFKDAALDALSAIEAPSDILFTREHLAPATHAFTAPKGRPPPKEKPITRSQKSKFIYFRSLDSPHIFVLRCPICHRSAFTSLQGLYNHARISHRVEWGTHEECVKACAAPQQDLGMDLDLEAGTDISGGSGIMPGVKSLFQMAVEERQRQGIEIAAGEDAEFDEGEGLESVHLTRTLGLHGDSPALAPFLGKEAKRRCIRSWNEDQDVDVCSFNGEERAARWKMPYTPRSVPRPEMNALAIMKDSQLTSAAHPLSTFNRDALAASRFHIACRVIATDSSLFIPEEQRPTSAKDHTHKWMLSVESASYSIDLTTVLNSLTVSSVPSDSLSESTAHIPTLTATKPPFLVVGTTSEPFLAKVELMFNSSTSGQGQNGQKFILDHWVGLDMIGTNKLPTKGDEQVVDIELDKDTVMKPAKTDYVPVNSRVHWEELSTDSSLRPGQNVGSDERKIADLGVETGKDTLDSYEAVLLSLLPRYPMTLKDISTNTSTRTGVPPTLPYKLMTNAQQLKTAVVGRRKAIEWARAKALHDAYSQRIETLQSGQEGKLPLIPLTVGDVYAWLEDEGHFIREKEDTPAPDMAKLERFDGYEKGKQKVSEQVLRGRWCRTCGLGLWVHGIENDSVPLPENTRKAPTIDGKATGLPKLKIRLLNGKVVGGDGLPSGSTLGTTQTEEFVCQIVPNTLKMCRLPVVDIERVLSARPHLQKQVQSEVQRPSSPSCLSHTSLSQPCTSRSHRRNRVFISTVDPPLLMGVYELVSSLRLPTFDAALSSGAKFPLVSLGSRPSEVDACLSPHAFLALAMTRLVRFLVTKAIEAERRDKEFGVGYMFQTQNRDVGLLATTQGPSKKGRNTTSGGNVNQKKEKEKERARIQSIRVLTPMHILSGVASSYVRASAQAAAAPVTRENLDEKGRSMNAAIAVFGCLTKLGIATVDREKYSYQ